MCISFIPHCDSDLVIKVRIPACSKPASNLMEVVRWHRNSEQLEMFRDGKLSVYFSGSQKVHLMAGLGTGFKIRIENSSHTFML